MTKARIEAFSDGVLAIIITIMVLELKSPESATFEALYPMAPSMCAYILSFVYVGIYWNNPKDPVPAAVYGAVLLAAALAWLVLQRAIIRGGGSLATMIGSDLKGKASPILYSLGIASSFVHAWIAEGLFAVVATLWLIPDRRIEKSIASLE